MSAPCYRCFDNPPQEETGLCLPCMREAERKLLGTRTGIGTFWDGPYAHLLTHNPNQTMKIIREEEKKPPVKRIALGSGSIKISSKALRLYGHDGCWVGDICRAEKQPVAKLGALFIEWSEELPDE